MIASPIRATWAALGLPNKSGELSAAHVPRTNAWVYKDAQGGFGLMLTGVDEPLRYPTLKNIRMVYKEEKIVKQPGESHRVRRCLEVTLDSSCSPEAMATVFERLALRQPSGSYSTADLMLVLRDAAALFEVPPAGAHKAEVIGVWGELWFIETLLGRCTQPELQLEVLRAWESEGPRRDIIDFRFHNAGMAVEIKTTLGDRVHHIQGFGQVTPPDGFSGGFLCSIVLREVDQGRSAARLAGDLSEKFRAVPSQRKSFETLLAEKLEHRGKECADDRYRFVPAENALRAYQMDKVPRPTPAEYVSSIEWEATLEPIQSLSERDADSLLQSLLT
jgi:hypothetical protein